MGNVLRFLCGGTTTGAAADSDQYLGHHGVSSATVGVSALAQDLYQFEINSQVPEGLKKHVVSSKKAQSNWYRKLSEAWRESKPPPKTPEEASRLVIQTLKRHQKADVEVDAKAVADGDTVTVYVSTAEPREASSVPREVQISAVQRSKARAERNYTKADALQKKITDAGYRGIDAPEGSMPYGKEAKEELTKILQGKCLRVLVFDQDRYGRCVGDIYCNGIFVQWEKEARAKRIGLWASSNPEMPWEWRKDRREGR
ncbi:hypothetical protein LguiA_017179 [Lonicera macranthoides]